MTFTALPSTLKAKMTLNTSKSFKDSVAAIAFGDEYKQMLELGLNPQTAEWSAEFGPIDAALKITMETFLSTVRASKTFTWTPAGEASEKKWRIKKDSIKQTPVSRGIWKFSMTFEQSFEM
jgi:phage-related protein